MTTIKDIYPFADWNPTGERPMLILGPCSAEYEEQLFTTAREIKELGRPFLLRAGIWKPRTRPGSFEGKGEEALQWLASVKEELQIPVTTEVANAEHVELCLKYGVDALWIGARTTVNPFSVQEIADALQGVDIPVFVKNPIHPDMGLWIGALERINRAGVNKLGAIHRGFHYQDNYPYRNLPNWELAIEMKTRLPELPIICDVSHIAGDPEIIPRVAQRAMDLYMDGLLIETHFRPEEALSDARQQVTPTHLSRILENLEIREPSTGDAHFTDEIQRLRARIDNIDESLMELLSERMKVVEEIGFKKKEQNVTIFQLERWLEIMENYMQWGSQLELRDEFIQRFLEALHLESIEIQQQVMNSQLDEDQSKV
ncbi:MAG: bifunctional 3-deoxy-7-phosphoheptulonate synthase/chorismate mutase type II [Flavobacteriales bacterium]|nr:bifunctional 3-deoxy-7-phosphoheptulonate synthase/chorismate mutase type II [Flavobacteriales bacterium]